MNYFELYNSFFALLKQDTRLKTHHVTLYLVLFFLWNKNRFSEFFPLYREHMFLYTKIGSTHTYYKCLNELHEWGYIYYVPAKNASSITMVKMFALDEFASAILTQANLFTSAKSTQAVHHADAKTTHALHHASAYMHHADVENASHYIHTNTYIDITDKTGVQNQHKQIINNSFEEEKRKKVALKKEDEMPPNEIDIIAFFEHNESTKEVARKFFLHYSSVGWVTKNNREIVNWKASAELWIKSEFTNKGTQEYSNNTGGDYDEKF